MPKPYFKHKNKPRFFNALKFKDQDSKAPKLGFLTEDVMSYYRQVSATLENGFDENEPDVKADFLNNVFMALKDEGIQVSQNQTVSRILEVLFTQSGSGHLRGLFAQFCKDLTIVSFDRFASHVFQALIHYLPMMYKDEEDKEELSELKASLKQLCQFMENHLRDIMTHTYGSHVLRSLLEVLSGVPVQEEVIRSRIARKRNAEKKIGFNQQLSQDYKEWFKMLKNKIIRLCNYEDHLNDNNYCPVLQTVLLIIHKHSISEYTELATTIISKVCPPLPPEESNDDVTKRLPALVQGEVGSYLMELLILLATHKQIKDLYHAVFKGKVIYFAVHPVANYVLQRLLTCVSEKDMFLELLEETTQYLEDVLAANHIGIVSKLVEACRKLRQGQDKVLKALMTAFHCLDPKDRQLKLVPLIASMQTHEVMYPEKEKGSSGVLNSVIIHGSLILQQLVHFNDTKLIASSLLSLSPAELSFLCCDKVGSHMVDAFFQSNSIKDKNREEFLQKLKGLYVNIACNRNGSRCMESIWKVCSLKCKTFIAEELVKSQERIESNQWGHFLYNNFALFKFTQRRKEWIDVQNGIFRKQQYLQNILEGKGEKKKNKTRKKHENQEQESSQTRSSELQSLDQEMEEFEKERRQNDQLKKRKASDLAQDSLEAHSSSCKKRREKKRVSMKAPQLTIIQRKLRK